MPVAPTRQQPVYRPQAQPSPIAAELRIHREALKIIYDNHRRELDSILKGRRIGRAS